MIPCALILHRRTLHKVDLQKLLDKAAGAEKANKFEDMMNLLGGNWAKVCQYGLTFT